MYNILSKVVETNESRFYPLEQNFKLSVIQQGKDYIFLPENE